jgi:hypothetical protein
MPLPSDLAGEGGTDDREAADDRILSRLREDRR